MAMQLRGQDLAVRLALMAGAAVAVNLPCGMWRAHLRRLSPSWFLAIHASIPAAISLRHALRLPRGGAILAVSIGSAVLGQQLGVQLEQRRIAARRRSGAGSNKGV